MFRLFSLSLFLIVIRIVNSDSINESLNWAEVTGTRLVSCYYHNLTGLMLNEEKWQSGNTLESLANLISIIDSPLKYIFNHTFIRTDKSTGGNCYDDHQWWLLAWIQIYQVDPNMKYLHRAKDIYDTITKEAWSTNQCSGGLRWCPTRTYKNAITNELFLSSSMRLHPYTSILGKSSNYYLDWAIKEWNWFENSGMINNYYLINDGLTSQDKSSLKNFISSNDNKCINNNGTTWTYNQGVILSGLALLYNATNNITLLNIAQNIADATIERLIYSNGILKEECEPNNCDNDQKLFKGIFIRHLGYLIPFIKDSSYKNKFISFIQNNTISILTKNRCEIDGLFGLLWNNNSSSSCQSVRNTATTSAALDLFTTLVKTKQSTTIITSSKFILFGLGNCIDEKNSSMPNFYSNRVNETICYLTAMNDKGAIAFDYQLNCNGNQFCRIRTLSDKHQTPPGFNYQDGIARNVTHTNKIPLTNCYIRRNDL
ncbi:unnamed protein product [Adineta steineri]|uniref:Mannan endo-1,6-alpha-mannosidase n=1 Tax=Adineta steineri TaxID=433720 RepID=A0A814DW24_9BILA|nr:unnamed protein product [Adineta steineri]CAF3973658.1 unnamed protein product [Adineta steineri]